ncbi:hypothetical protein MKY59_29540 [Paenibacillus sp. FSL W8-0426]|uniref:hypothetical protein n=1 Tax=Paenibacillus sp. FSL W8-0426 TaxID=2921714 RepID=UPI0030DA7BCB
MDKKALKILQSFFWGNGGWKSPQTPFTGEDFEYAKSKGVMFDPLTISHDEIVQRLHSMHQKHNIKEQAAIAFLHSLSTRKVHLRSALSSWALTAPLPLHTYGERPALHANSSACGDCNFQRLRSDREYVAQDLNVLNFERIRWGGVRHDLLLYCLMDLELLLTDEDTYEVTDADIAILRGMLETIYACEPGEGARKLEKRWKTIFPSNQYERDAILEIWSAAGILAETDTPRIGRGGSSDFRFASTWQGNDRYSEEAVKSYFGAWLS